MTEPLNKQHDVEMGSDRSFGFVFAAVFGIIALWPLMRGEYPRLWASSIALAFLIVAFSRPRLLRPLNIIWFRFGLLLSAVVTPIVMALLYLTTIVPMGIFLRLRGKDLLGLKRQPERTSYWITREPGPKPGTMKRQF